MRFLMGKRHAGQPRAERCHHGGSRGRGCEGDPWGWVPGLRGSRIAGRGGSQAQAAPWPDVV